MQWRQSFQLSAVSIQLALIADKLYVFTDELKADC